MPLDRPVAFRRPTAAPVDPRPMRRLLAGVLVALAVAACGGGADDGGRAACQPQSPSRVLTW